jgi:hypothetical protein
MNAIEAKVNEQSLEILAANRERFKDWHFVAGDVRGHIVNYKWVSIHLEGRSTVYTNYHDFLECEYRQNAQVTAFEYKHLKMTEEALLDCRAGRINTELSKESTHKATFIETDDYGTLVKYRPNQLINIGGTNRLAAHILATAEGHLFINEIHTSKKGLGAVSSVTIYHIAQADSTRDKTWTNAFQVNVESNTAEWATEVKALNELKDTLTKWNTHSHLVSFDNQRGVWVVQPKLHVVEEPVKEVVEEQPITEEQPAVQETVATDQVEEDPTEKALEYIAMMPQEKLDKLAHTLANSYGYIIPEATTEVANKN